MKLLIVEDNVQMRRLIVAIVRDMAESICECCDGAEALEAYLANLPDWILMDIKMPKVDGITATKQIKDACPEANIIIVTDYDDPLLRTAASQAGATEYVAKDNLIGLRRLLEH